ncbi:MAG: hypothetical protein D6812_08625 [Deltaproteobacteria bacterium]|nr:MAG: hypothetical protein D6812_08625 [Deltaproteobacteria bacterium]
MARKSGSDPITPTRKSQNTLENLADRSLNTDREWSDRLRFTSKGRDRERRDEEDRTRYLTDRVFP